MFRDREDAGRRLAAALASYKSAPDGLVLAIPRGGVVVGFVVARELRLPLEVILTKKIGHPLQPEFAVGVVSLTGESIDREVVERERIGEAYLRSETARIRSELRRRQELIYGRRAGPSLKGRTAIVVDDGAATGYTMLAALRLARAAGAREVVAAVPVAPAGTLEALRREADRAVCPLLPDSFFAIGQFYDDFDQVSDEEAVRLLRQAAPALRASS